MHIDSSYIILFKVYFEAQLDKKNNFSLWFTVLCLLSTDAEELKMLNAMIIAVGIFKHWMCEGFRTVL